MQETTRRHDTTRQRQKREKKGEQKRTEGIRRKQKRRERKREREREEVTLSRGGKWVRKREVLEANTSLLRTQNESKSNAATAS